MRIIVLIALAVLAYYGWQAYQKDPQFLAKYLPNQQSEEVESAESIPVEDPAPPTPTPSAPPAPTAPAFQSRIAVPTSPAGEKGTLPPGQFLVIERASVEHKDGVTAIVPGDTVKLIERRSNGTLQVTNGQIDFVVKESQVTQDIAVAQEAERREFQKRYGNLR